MVLSYFAYLSILIFAAVVLYRVVRVAATPVHLRWELYPVPHEAGGKAKYGGSYLEEVDWWTKKTGGSRLNELTVMIPEIFLLKGVWEANRGLWFWSWAFHFGLYGAILEVCLLIAAVIFGAGSTIGALFINIAGYVALVACILGVLGCLGMLVKRIFNGDMSRYSSFATYFNLLFILAIFATGLAAVATLGMSETVGQVQLFLANLLTLETGYLLSGLVAAHIAIVLAFMIYMPFTHMIHFVMKYFTYHDIRWNDEPNYNNPKLEKKIGKALNYRPTWAAEHLKADGKKNWVDIATEEIGKDEKKS